MREFRKTKAIAAFAAIFLLVSAATNSAGTTFVYGSAFDDKARPWVRIISPQTQTIVPTSTGAITLAGIANDRPGGSGVKVVEVKVNGSRYTAASPIVKGDWTYWSVTVNVQSPGVYRITPRVTDHAGNQAWNSIYVKVTMDSNPPSVSISSPQAGATIATGSLLVRGTAHDADSGIRMLRVGMDGAAQVNAIPKAPGDWSSWSVSFSALTEGQHVIRASATDRAGNVEESTVSVIARANAGSTDTVSPTVIASPGGGTFNSAQ
jgi:hypothetical protein